MSQRVSVSYSLRRHYIDQFHVRSAAHMPKTRLLLDVGGHRAGSRGRPLPYHDGIRRVILNLAPSAAPDVIADAHRLPIASRSVVAVLCTEVLEHVAEPAEVLREISRVLVAGGRLYATTPFLYPVHGDPQDFQRFTPIWWRRQLARLGFDVESIEPHGGYWSVMVDNVLQLLTEGLARRDLRSRLVRTLLQPFGPFLKSTALRWDEASIRRQDPFHERFATGYGVVAIKRLPDGPLPTAPPS